MLLSYFLEPAGVPGRYNAIKAEGIALFVAFIAASLAILSVVLSFFSLMFIPLPLLFLFVAADAGHFCAQAHKTPEYAALRDEMDRAEERRRTDQARAEAEEEQAEAAYRLACINKRKAKERKEAEERQRAIEEREKFWQDYPHVAREQEAERQREHERRMAEHSANCASSGSVVSDLLSTALVAGAAYSIGASQKNCRD